MIQYIGLIIVGVLGFYLISTAVPAAQTASTILAWMVPILMWRKLGKTASQQAVCLIFIGLSCLMFSASRGVFLGWELIFSANLPPLAMFVAVAFLTLTNPACEDPELPKGTKAIVTTAIGTHLLGAVINLSVLFIFGDRLQRRGVLSREQLIILPRSFCAAAWWSPFFIATGVTLTYAPGMQWLETLVPGAIMSVIAILYSFIEVRFFRKTSFSGYPIRIESLFVPVILAASVICLHHFKPDISIIRIICLLSPVGALIFMKGRPRMSTFKHFVGSKLTSVNSQFALFLAAGVFSTGIKSLTLVYPTLFSFSGATFTPLIFTLVLGAMIAVGTIGVHPLMSIAIVSPLLIPLSPDNSQLGFLFLSSWAISTGSSPLSGVGLALTSRYHASPREIVQNNWHYAIAMWAITSILNLLFF